MKKLAKLISGSVLVLAVLCLVVGIFTGSDEDSGSVPPTFTPWPTTASTPKLHTTHTAIFEGQTPGEALTEWKESFPERTVIEFSVGVDANGTPVELEIKYTK